jgi:hypothetical protein
LEQPHQESGFWIRAGVPHPKAISVCPAWARAPAQIWFPCQNAGVLAFNLSDTPGHMKSMVVIEELYRPIGKTYRVAKELQ